MAAHRSVPDSTGYTYSEDSVGTDAIGTALAMGAPAFIMGRKHFADVLTRHGPTHATGVVANPLGVGAWPRRSRYPPPFEVV